MRQRFKIGEDVYLKSRYQPKYNGRYTILDVMYDKSIRYQIDGSTGYRYKLAVIGADGPYWCESALRRLPKVSDMSFMELMDSLNSPVKAQPVVKEVSP